MKTIQVFIQTIFLLIVLVFASIAALMLRLTMCIGFGKRWHDGLVNWMQSLIPLNILEAQPHEYPVPDTFKEQGHIRFTAKRTHNAKGVELNLDEVDAMLYVARVNFPQRLVNPSEATIRQLKYAFAKRRLFVQKVYLYGPNNDQLDSTIKL